MTQKCPLARFCAGCDFDTAGGKSGVTEIAMGQDGLFEKEFSRGYVSMNA